MRPARIGLGTALSSFVLLATSLHAQSWDRCDYKRELASTMAVSADALVSIEAGAGSLTVRGVPGLREARVRGSACATSASLLDQVSISVTREASGVRVRTLFPDRNPRNEWARIDLVIEVPAGINADVEDGSGSIELSGLGRVDVDDGSGEMTLADIAGPITIEDGSGDITLSNVRGTVALVDGSGNVDIRGAGGDVRVEDGSGSMSIREVRGSVRVADSSGSVDVRGVRGDFIVTRDGSGSISHRDVEGRVDIPRRRD